MKHPKNVSPQTRLGVELVRTVRDVWPDDLPLDQYLQALTYAVVHEFYVSGVPEEATRDCFNTMIQTFATAPKTFMTKEHSEPVRFS